LKISYLPQANIDKSKWDRCIDTSPNGLIYAYSFYLDAMSENWDALILDDYEMIMPLTWKKKYTIHYLYQPVFAASLGIFGNNISAQKVKSFLEKIPSKFKYWDFYLNRDNLFSIPGFPMYERSNYILPLLENYENLKSKYASSHVRNIKRAIQFGNVVKKNIPIADVITLAKEQAKNFSSIEEKSFTNFSSLYQFLKEKNSATTYGVYSPQNKLVASCAYFFSHNRAYYILVGNRPDGSNIPSLAFFYKNFGSRLEKYPGIKMNKLPAIAKLFKQ
jgi:hypothetical protein